ncbi:hypothetical protein A3D72_02720 [Candidatus Uhrbacteria bacterium RIFCSPHIGHO2_02_FULL_57_19]|uniref:Pyrrolo-quinoline quinone repeat domain-containing protein n=1 Tax=Candidatus Uhrbacteria bacterium RIFCSPHIGHO2_02_FULL_57_19 TaxID=1802391 RepID=A0A1F7U1Y9_9BACT|nr:MAG: hypothetical protein A3D72_02720 [Candidatus Uhrbacteria bacterium RIFCSPHIGHO2_02_FULL_57_19]
MNKKNVFFVRLVAFAIGVALLFGASYLQNKYQKTAPSEPLLEPATLIAKRPDQLVSYSVGPVTLSTTNPVIITGLESSTNFYITAANTSDQVVTINVVMPDRQSLPDWIFHLFQFQPGKVSIPARGETTLEYLVSNEGDGETELSFAISVIETGESGTLPVTIISENSRNPAQVGQELPSSAAVAGKVTNAAGEPVAGASVDLRFLGGRYGHKTTTDESGHYLITTSAIEDLQAYLGTRPLPYPELSYYLIIEADGFELGYLDGLQPAGGETLAADVELVPRTRTITYRQKASFTTDGAYGYSAVMARRDFRRVIGFQYQHPPEKHEPGHFVAIDQDGNEVWRIATGDECWGYDVASDGKVAAGCHDGKVYMADDQGELLWKIQVSESRDLNREVEFSPDGTELLTGPFRSPRADAALLDASTGEPKWTFTGPNQWLRNSRWSPDGSRVVAAFGQGMIVMLTRDGRALWTRSIGEFPTLLEVDKEGNVAAAGKNREVFSFDKDGNLRWRTRIANHVVTDGGISADGTLIVVATVGDWVVALNNRGEIVWQRPVPFVGGNSLDLTPDGELIMIGTTILNRRGTIVWQDEAGGESGVMSDDGQFLAVGDRENSIRIYRRLDGD